MRELSLSQYAETYLDRPGTEAARIFETEAADCLLPRREKRAHKYRFGRALVIAGSLGYSGAPVLAANACERSGAGLTHLMVPASIYPIAAARCDGAVVTPLSDTDGGISPAGLPGILTALQRANACVIGPGLGIGEAAEEVVASVLRAASCPLVLDADALTVCGRAPELLKTCRAPLILTPHEGEFQRLGGDLKDGRLSAARRFCKEHPGITLILKGYGSLVSRDGELSVNPTGGPAMAKGGAGDVLCGILCALLAQGMEVLPAARCAVYLHGLAGDLAAAELGEYSLAPSDLIRFLPGAFRRLPQA